MNIYKLTNGDHIVVVAANDENEARNMVYLQLEGSQQIHGAGQPTHSSSWHSCIVEPIEESTPNYSNFTIIENNNAENQ